MTIALALIPEVLPVVQSILNLKKAYPQLTNDQIVSLVSDITTISDATFNDILAKIAAEKKGS